MPGTGRRRLLRIAAITGALGAGLGLGLWVAEWPGEAGDATARLVEDSSPTASGSDTASGRPTPSAGGPAGDTGRAGPAGAPDARAEAPPEDLDGVPDPCPGPAEAGLPDATGAIVPAEASIGEDSARTLLAELWSRELALPVDGMAAGDVGDHFRDPRGGGRIHHAVDIVAPRGTPVRAVEAGTVAHTDTAQAGGGIVVYLYGPEREFIYYYAHLDALTPGLSAGDAVEAGQLLGRVGTTGNAPSGVPHLHFAIHKTLPQGRWWRGIPLNPFLVYGRG